MNGFFIKWFISAVALWFVVWIIPGITVDRWETLGLASLILSLLNTFIRPAITWLTLPLQIFTLGIFTLLVNGFLFSLVGKMVEGFYVAEFASAFWGALLYSIFSFLLNIFVQPNGQFRFYYQGYRKQSSPPDDQVIDVEGHVIDGEEEKKKIE